MITRCILALAVAAGLTSCAGPARAGLTHQESVIRTDEFPLSLRSRTGEQTGDWLKAVCRARSRPAETCVSYVWGVIDSLTRWPPSDLKPFCISGMSYGAIEDGIRSHIASVSDTDAALTDAVSLVRQAVSDRFPC